METFKWKNSQISYLDQGSGFPILLLHGYLETKEVWGGFGCSLAANYRVIAPDIPGHGQSSTIDSTHSMELMATVMAVLLDHLSVTSCVVVGHSMGGYVALALAEKFPARISGLVLFHSPVYADTEEKKASRMLELEKINQGQMGELAIAHIPKTFANKNVESFQTEIQTFITTAKTHSPEGVSALIRGMMDRPDRQKLVTGFTKPLLFLMGPSDNFISKEAAERMAALNRGAQLEWLENSGHMGFIEEPDESFRSLKLFIDSQIIKHN
ncbi:MAG TPA: alpha/beta hydrolase [Marinilabiliales bacterium]|nr:MAG: hypothetical protein A2W95_07685 [Bacteroidetes bacterium GWA2_40_14]OFX75591.1 MAG: hypothetical protein A2W96_08895 [Bacteroidetes bacterium GWD2_40_43]OFX90691.1 MAG: hypothetical protein A2W97_02900 [Bacteroidetes bacterium GWE2_40_63]OFY20831.1 MAG: hypothetical protein A2W88_17365 [Bacteroidetes bacterium GWF2_40_13]OFZ23749.1 MAG: hypothetical protein A2437_06890 [Bacteroidetes bacterium RIFOXYC2_FULL_40_12]HAN00601.1 alpha/beta hydrolase [Marinilabiliales bacterium]